jgi:hypothetical protein
MLDMNVDNLKSEYEDLGEDISRLQYTASYSNNWNSKEIDKIGNTRHNIATKISNIVSNVNHYSTLGFEKVCDVSDSLYNNDGWLYSNINQSLLYADHTSWVYFVVEDDIVVKVGESGVPLGIRTKYHGQPLSGTKCRFGRLANHKNDNTDSRIRESLKKSVTAGKVSLWAKKCEIELKEMKLEKNPLVCKKVYHKELELAILDYMSDNHYWPKLNTFRK